MQLCRLEKRDTFIDILKKHKAYINDPSTNSSSSVGARAGTLLTPGTSIKESTLKSAQVETPIGKICKIDICDTTDAGKHAVEMRMLEKQTNALQISKHSAEEQNNNKILTNTKQQHITIKQRNTNGKLHEAAQKDPSSTVNYAANEGDSDDDCNDNDSIEQEERNAATYDEENEDEDEECIAGEEDPSADRDGWKERIVQHERLKPFELLPYQIVHYNEMEACLNRNSRYLSKSVMGAGKTILALEYCRRMGLVLLLIGPAGMIIKWQLLAARQGVKVIDALSYARLRGAGKNRPLNHEWLTRRDMNVRKLDAQGRDRSYVRTEYIPTSALHKIVEAGALLVVDESQNGKNNGSQHMAICALASVFYQGHVGDGVLLAHPKRSGALFLSATPVDKEEHSVTLLRMLGFLPHVFYEYTPQEVLYTHDRKTDKLLLHKAAPFFNLCKHIDAKHTLIHVKEVMNDSALKEPRKRFNRLMYKLLVTVMMPRFSGAMSLQSDQPKDIKNGYYKMETEKEMNDYAVAVDSLASAVSWSNNHVFGGGSNFAEITRSLSLLERAKLRVLVRLIRLHLIKHPKSKVVVFVTYRNSLDYLERRLQNYSPLRLDGSVSKLERARRNDLFQVQSLAHRLLIANLRVGSVGLDMHDTHGEFPRHMFIIPNYDIQLLHQATGRTIRAGCKSGSTIRFVYINNIEDDDDDDDSVLSAQNSNNTHTNRVKALLAAASSAASHTKKTVDAEEETMHVHSESASLCSEVRILHALARKSEVMKTSVQEQVKDGVTFAVDYESEIETRLNQRPIRLIIATAEAA